MAWAPPYKGGATEWGGHLPTDCKVGLERAAVPRVQAVLLQAVLLHVLLWMPWTISQHQSRNRDSSQSDFAWHVPRFQYLGFVLFTVFKPVCAIWHAWSRLSTFGMPSIPWSDGSSKFPTLLFLAFESLKYFQIEGRFALVKSRFLVGIFPIKWEPWGQENLPIYTGGASDLHVCALLNENLETAQDILGLGLELSRFGVLIL